MTTKEAAEYLRCSTKTIYRLVQSGAVTASAKLRHLKINRDDVERLGAPE
jgi:excisionase family DNA binding protein